MKQQHLFDPPPFVEQHFDGSTYEPDKDQVRLGEQAQDVWDLMRDGVWRTLATIELVTGYPQASISARLRDFRKERFGGHTVERRRMSKISGLYEYRLIQNSPSEPA